MLLSLEDNMKMFLAIHAPTDPIFLNVFLNDLIQVVEQAENESYAISVLLKKIKKEGI